MEPTSAPTDATSPVAPTTPATTSSTTVAQPAGTAEHELLVEEISIDGMCGVY